MISFRKNLHLNIRNPIGYLPISFAEKFTFGPILVHLSAHNLDYHYLPSQYLASPSFQL